MKIEFICDNCGKIIIKTKMKDINRKKHFCDKICHTAYLKKMAYSTNCLFCKKETTNPKFCSKTCAASYNNKLSPKRKRNFYLPQNYNKKNNEEKIKFCIVCGKITTYRSKYCKECNPQIVDWSKTTIKEIRYTSSHRSNLFAKIRDNAKRVFKQSNLPKSCVYCGYQKHFEVCHIKPIYMFDENTTISVVNDLSNLIALCPNCHWELDNGLINIDNLRIGSPG